jgi:hypothetical protein
MKTEAFLTRSHSLHAEIATPGRSAFVRAAAIPGNRPCPANDPRVNWAKGPVAGAEAVLSEERFALMRAYSAVPDPALRHALCEIFKSAARAMTGAASDDETVRACPSASR